MGEDWEELEAVVRMNERLERRKAKKREPMPVHGGSVRTLQEITKHRASQQRRRKR